MRRIVAAVVVLLSAVAVGQPAVVFVPQSVNVKPLEVQAFTAVCRAEWGRLAGREMVPLKQADEALAAAANPLAAAQALGVAEYVTFELIGLTGAPDQEPRILVAASRRDGAGAELHHADLSLASLTDAPAGCNRLARALLNKVTVDAARDRSNVTAADAEATANQQRLGTEKVFGVKSSFSYPLVSGADINPVASIQFNARLERERYFLELGVGVVIPAVVKPGALSWGGITTEVGASYYLTAGDIAPYAGLGVMPRILIGTSSIVSLAPYAQAGVMLWRESSTRLYAELRVAQNVLPVSAGSSGQPLFPTELGAQVGVGF